MKYKSSFIICLLFSILFTGISFFFVYNRFILLTQGIKTTGTVTKVLNNRSIRGGPTIEPTIEFRTKDNQKVVVKGNMYHSQSLVDRVLYKKPIKGSSINLIYLENKKEEPELDSFGNLFGMPILLFSFLILFLFLTYYTSKPKYIENKP